MIKFGNYIIKRFWIVLSVSFILVITGMVGFNQMPKKNMPSMNLPLSVTTIAAPTDTTPGGISAEDFEHKYVAEIEEVALDIDEMESVQTIIMKITDSESGIEMNFAQMISTLDAEIQDPSEYWEDLEEDLEELVPTLEGWPTFGAFVTLDADFATPQGAFFVKNNEPVVDGEDNPTTAELFVESLEKSVKDITETEVHYGSLLNNEEATFVTYYLDGGIDQTNTRSDINKVVDEYNNDTPGTITTLSSEPDDVAAAISGVMKNLILALLIVGVVVFIGLGLMNAIGVVITIPVIILSTSAVLWIIGKEVNTFTIAGIIISIGILVDNSIVISDSIQARIDNGADRKTAAAKAIRDNWIPVAAATATTIAAFLPMLMLPGIAGNFIFMLPFTVMITIAISYVLALTLMPVLSTFLFKKNEKRAAKNANNEYSKVESVVNKMSKWTLLHPIKTVAITVGVLIGTVAIAAPNMKFEMMPQAEINAVTIEFSAADYQASTAEIMHQEIVDVIDEHDFVENYVSTVGGELPVFSGYIYSTQLSAFEGAFVIWVDDHYSEMDKYADIFNADFKDAGIEVQANIVEMNFPGPAASVSIYLEDDFDEAKFDALEDVALEMEKELLTMTDLVSEVEVSMPSNGPIQRIDGKRVVTVSVYSSVATEIEVGQGLKDVVDDYVDDDLYDTIYGGTYSENAEMIKNLMIIFMIAMAVIMGILIAQFRSVIKPLMVLSLVPFSFIGVLWIFLITGNALSMTGLIGVVALTGLVVNAGILLVEQVTDGQHDGMEPKEAIEQAVMKRFRPIAISACTTIVGLVPLAIAKDPFFTPMSLIMIGGLLTSTFLALFTFPALLTFVTKNKETKAKKIKA